MREEPLQESPTVGPFGPQKRIDRRHLLQWSAATLGLGSVTAASVASDRSQGVDGERLTALAADDRRASPKRYAMKKSINLWAFPYPQRMTLKECLVLAKRAGFDGIELNYDLDNDLSPKASAKDLAGIRKLADEIGIEISGLCSFLFWPYPLTSNDAAKRSRAIELAG